MGTMMVQPTARELRLWAKAISAPIQADSVTKFRSDAKPFDPQAKPVDMNSIPPIIYLISPSESMLHVKEGTDIPTVESATERSTIIINTMTALERVVNEVVKPAVLSLPNEQLLPIGYVFDARSGYFAIKTSTLMPHLVVAESFSLLRAFDRHEESYALLKGIFWFDNKARIRSVSVTLLTDDAERARKLAEEKITLEQTYFQLGRRLKSDLGFAGDLPVTDQVPAITEEVSYYLAKRGIGTLDDFFIGSSAISFEK